MENKSTDMTPVTPEETPEELAPVPAEAPAAEPAEAPAEAPAAEPAENSDTPAEVTEAPAGETAEPTEAPAEVAKTPAEAAGTPTETPADGPAAPETPVKKEKGKWRSRLPLVVCCVLLVLAAAGGAVFSRYIPGPGGLYPRDAQELDLRSESVSVEQYQRLQSKLPGCHIRWSIPLSGGRFDSLAEEIRLTALSADELEHFALFERLTHVDGTDCTDYDALLQLRESRPELDVTWTLELEGASLAQDSREAAFNAAGTDFDRLAEMLRFLPELETVTVHGKMDPDTQTMLMETYPQVVFDWDVALCSKTFRSTAEELSFAGEALTEADLREIEENAFRFYHLNMLDMTGCGIDSDRLAELRSAIGAEIAWEFELYGLTVSSLDTGLDFSDIPIEDVSVLENAIPYFSRLERVDMHHCGVPNEVMAGLNEKYEDIKFVWTVRVRYYGVRTDATYFIVYNCTEHYLYDAGVEQLKYCTDLIALDLGHMRLDDISFLQYMPNMQYLIFAECAIKDITLIGELKELKWLELFKASVRDISPLLGCTKLESLNLCYIYADDSAYDTLVQMTWLDRLWYSGNWMSPQQQRDLVATLSDTQVCLVPGGESTGNGWRYHEDYYEMRDAFNMYYMDEEGNRTTIKRYE